jgi:hypothetical protein
MRQATRTELDDEQMDDAWAGGEVARQTRRLQAAAERAGSARVGQRTHQTDNRPLIHVSTALCHMSNQYAGQWSVVAVMGTVMGTVIVTFMATVTHVHPSPCRDDNNGGDIR